MEYQKTCYAIHQTIQLNLEQKKTNDESHGVYNTNGQIRFKTSMLKSSLCDYSNAYVLVKGNITVANTGPAEVPN